MTPACVAIIPARGGSKGLPRKNSLPLGGLPLIAYSIRLALAVPEIDAVVVSTEDEELARIARDHGALTPFVRPPELAGDSADLGRVIDHAHAALREVWSFPDRYALLTLLPTSPFRNATECRELTRRALEGFNVLSVTRSETRPESLAFGRFMPEPASGSGRAASLARMRAADSEAAVRASEGGGFLTPNGYFLAASWGHETPRPACLHSVDDPIKRLDVDEWEDFYLAEEIVANGLFDFGLRSPDGACASSGGGAR